jgi:tetratricopeptide (TPR) repeat protein
MNCSHFVKYMVFVFVVAVNALGVAQEYDRHLQDGLAALRTRDYRGALERFGRAVSLDPWRGTAYYLRGRTYLALEQYEDAISDFNRTIDLLPGHAAAYLGRASARAATGDPSGGLEDAETANRILLERLRWITLLRQARDRAHSPGNRNIEEGMEVDRIERERRQRHHEQRTPPKSKTPAEPPIEPFRIEAILGCGQGVGRT